MLIDMLLKLAASLVQFLLGFFPAVALPFSPSDFVSAWSLVRPYAALADYWAPVHEALAIVVAVLGIRLALIAWSAVNWLYKRVPILGH